MLVTVDRFYDRVDRIYERRPVLSRERSDRRTVSLRGMRWCLARILCK